MLVDVTPATPSATLQTADPALLESGDAEDDDLACGHRWTGPAVCDTGVEHMCTRTSPHHRSHMCACLAVDFRRSPVGSHAPSAFDTTRQR
jgi:hypothetical protein